MLFLCLKHAAHANVSFMLGRIWNILDLKVKAGVIATALLLAIFVVNLLPSGSSRIENALLASGFTLSKAEDVNTRPGKVILRGISLDPDGFSMIGKLTATGTPLFPLMGQPKRLNIEDLQVTGEWNEEQGLSFAGWSLPRTKSDALAHLERIILGSSIIDLDTPAGALRLELAGESARHPEYPDQQVFNARLSGKQHQLVLDSQIKGTWSMNKGLTLESEIREARVNLEHLVASRVTGWLALETQRDSPIPALSGQIQAGQFGRDNMKLNNVTLTLDGPVTMPHAIISAELGGLQSTTLMLEISSEKEGAHIAATIETRTLDDLLAALSEFRTQAETSPFLQETLMSLLITEGNMDRIRQDLKKDKYESFALEIEGFSHDLKGKVIGRKIENGVMQRQIFSLNPSIAAGGN